MEIALIIIHNHKYDSNIEVLERIYKGRFSNIFHLVPFYEGNRDNVIPVYENSFFFQGYIAQGCRYFFNEKFDHYFFVADDMIVNPLITERNYTDQVKLKAGTAFIPRFIPFNKDCVWPRLRSAYHYHIATPGVEVANELPSTQDALKKFAQFNLAISPFTYYQLYDKKELPKRLYRFKEVLGYFKEHYNHDKNKSREFDMPYPLIGGYSDIFIVPGTTIKKFSHYAGVFAATELFVEIAIPTALVLSSDAIITEADIEFRGKALWPKGWLNIADEDMSVLAEGLGELEQYDNSLKKLLSDFPSKYLYLHPVKLSKWDTAL